MTSSVVALPVLQITAKSDLFRCVPYNATISAGSCVLRQSTARAPRPTGLASTPSTKYAECKDCELGRQVAERLSAPQQTTQGESAEPACTKCGRFVKGTSNREDLKRLCIACRNIVWAREAKERRRAGITKPTAPAINTNPLNVSIRPGTDPEKLAAEIKAAFAAPDKPLERIVDEQMIDRVARCIRVVGRLGGIDRAEKLADVVNFAGGVP